MQLSVMWQAGLENSMFSSYQRSIVAWIGRLISYSLIGTVVACGSRQMETSAAVRSDQDLAGLLVAVAEAFHSYDSHCTVVLDLTGSAMPLFGAGAKSTIGGSVDTMGVDGTIRRICELTPGISKEVASEFVRTSTALADYLTLSGVSPESLGRTYFQAESVDNVTTIIPGDFWISTDNQAAILAFTSITSGMNATGWLLTLYRSTEWKAGELSLYWAG